MERQEYWNERFKTEDEYEWYLSYSVLRPIITKQLDKDASILVLGCGTSPLSAELHRDGFANVVNIDYSPVVINKMKKRHPELEWRVMDAERLEFEAGRFDLVIEKAVIDIFLVGIKDQWHLSAAKSEQLARVCGEVSRVLKPRGRFLSVTFSPPHFRKMVLARSEFGWSIDTRQFDSDGTANSGGSFEFYVYAMAKGERLCDKDLEYERVQGKKLDHIERTPLEENDIFAIDL